MKVEEVRGAALDELIDELADLRHDLGKYIGFDTRMVGDDVEALREALTKDLFRTRDHDGVATTCWQIWDRLRPTGLEGDPDVQAIDRLLALLRDLPIATADLALLEQARGYTKQVTETTKRLYARAVAHRGGA